MIWSHETKKHLAEWQTTQRGKKNKEIASFKKLTTFLLKVPLHHLPSSKVLFVSCDRLVQRAHFKGHIQFARRVFGGKKSVTLQFLFCQEIVCPPSFFIKKTDHIQVSNKVLRINKGKKNLMQLSYYLLTLKAKAKFALDNPGKNQLKLLPWCCKLTLKWLLIWKERVCLGLIQA